MLPAGKEDNKLMQKSVILSSDSRKYSLEHRDREFLATMCFLRICFSNSTGEQSALLHFVPSHAVFLKKLLT